MTENAVGRQWLVLIYQFPQVPGSRRVKAWRRLQGIGAVAIKNSAYVLPLNDQSREDFEWLLTEMTESGAEGVILESRLVGGLSDQEIEGQFNAARDADYLQLVEDLENAKAALSQEDVGGESSVRDMRRALARARKRIADIEAIDFFGAGAHEAAEASLRELDQRILQLSDSADRRVTTMTGSKVQDLKKRVWVTRRNVRVDRIASAWFIRRWIDPDAEFKFVAGEGYTPAEREIRFDMFAAEFTHDADMCTFEVLNRLLGADDHALNCIAEIVHDIDLKDGKFARPETEGIAHLLTGLVSGTEDDTGRLERGGAMFEDLYRYFRQIPK
jgi:hypothetical protein